MIVETKNGKLRGSEENGIAVFKGIPYAKPPVGDLRWKAPLPAEDWEGVRDALEFGNIAVQPVFDAAGYNYSLSNSGTRSEDCLYLNIWAPVDAVKEGQKLPVLFVIHGGGFTYFSGATPWLGGADLAGEGIVVVTINYRLGAMGFFSHPELDKENEHGVSGNYGILDQIEALRWVRRNISAFGGDKDRVTFSGESAGAFSASILCMTPLASGLFARVAAQSGSFTDYHTVMCDCQTLEEAEASWLKVCGGKSIEELRAMAPDEILKLQAAVDNNARVPVRDGYVFPADPAGRFKDGSFIDVPLMIGSNKDDGSQFHSRKGDPDELKRIGEGLAGRENLEKFMEIYPAGDKEKTNETMTQLFSDSGFGHGMYKWAGLQNRFGKSEVYLYRYCHIPPDDNGFGSYHSSELYYFYRKLGLSDNKWREEDYRLEGIFSGYFLNFIKYGDPNGIELSDGSDGLPEWKTFGDNPENIMILDETPHMELNPRLDAMKFWDGFYG